MPASPARGRFVAGFITGGILAAVATAGAQSMYPRLSGGRGMAPGASAFVLCTDQSMTFVRQFVSPVPGYVATTAPNGARQDALTITCPP